MADQWEMCTTNRDVVFIYSPKKTESMTHKTFIMRYEEQSKQHKGAFGEYYEATTVHLLLSDGWEPYAVGANNYYFRRKYQG